MGMKWLSIFSVQNGTPGKSQLRHSRRSINLFKIKKLCLLLKAKLPTQRGQFKRDSMSGLQYCANKMKYTLSTGMLTGLIALFGLSACTEAYIKSIGGDTEQLFTRIYLTDINTAWQSALESLKNSRLDVSNQEGGFIQTKWTDNTTDRNFAESFGTADSYLKAQYRLRLSVSKGFYNGHPTVKISVEKEQLVQKDVLEGWRPTKTDSIDETTLLYRIGRLIYIKMQLAKIEEDKAQKEMENVKF
jgi:hypothetical protein